MRMPNKKEIRVVPSENAFYAEVVQLLRQARQRTYTVIQSVMVETYWQIGRRIVEQEQAGSSRANYGAELLKNLSKALTGEFGKGFSAPNLRNFRQFYLTFPDEEKCYTLCSKLSWSHLRLIMRDRTISPLEILYTVCSELSRSRFRLKTKPSYDTLF